MPNIFDDLVVKPKNGAFDDGMISSKINSMVNEGWNLVYVASAVESEAGEQTDMAYVSPDYPHDKRF